MKQQATGYIYPKRLPRCECLNFLVFEKLTHPSRKEPQGEYTSDGKRKRIRRIINLCLCFQVLYILIAISGLWQVKLVLLLFCCSQALHLLLSFFFGPSHISSLYLLSKSLLMLYSFLLLSWLTLNTDNNYFCDIHSVAFLLNNSCSLSMLVCPLCIQYNSISSQALFLSMN